MTASGLKPAQKKVIAVFLALIIGMALSACKQKQDVPISEETGSAINVEENNSPGQETDSEQGSGSVAEPVTDPVSESTQGADPKLVPGSTTKPALETAPGSTSKPATEPVTKKTPELAQEQTTESKAQPAQTFPFKDKDGNTRYRLMINGNEVETQNWPFTYPDEPKGGLYPIKDVLAYFGVECLCDPNETSLTARINGKVLKVAANNPEMVYGDKSVKGMSKAGTPVSINNCLYVPSFLCMVIFDDGIVDFSADRSTATLETKTIINLAESGTSGLSIPINQGVNSEPGGNTSGGASGQFACGTCGGSGKSICTYCGGTGSKIEFQQTYDPVTHSYKQTQKQVFCPRCGGRGSTTCSTCGGSGQR
jgi:hypothetical protein